MDRHVVAAAGLLPALAVSVVDFAGLLASGEEGWLDVAARADALRPARRRRADPDRRMRLLIRTRPDVHRAVVKKSSLVAERPVVMSPGFDDEVDRLPLTLVHARRIAVRRQHFVGN